MCIIIYLQYKAVWGTWVKFQELCAVMQLVMEPKVSLETGEKFTHVFDVFLLFLLLSQLLKYEFKIEMNKKKLLGFCNGNF